MIAGKYSIERVLGEGGMGTVYAAHHELLDQRVALKILFEDAGRDKEAAARFLQEARSAARLQSEHVARVMDIDTLDNGLPYIVMEYLEGSDLGQELERKRVFSPAKVVDFALQALEAIAQAHAQGIIHRDLKPSNLFLAVVPDGSQIIKVLDFGISKPTFGRVSSITSSRSVLGSPPYMSPEQVRRPRTVDTRTDIWSVGILLYELLTGKMPFDGEEVGELFAAILEQEPRPIRSHRPDVPEGLERVIMRCLSKNREKRFPDVGELARALAPFGTGSQNKSIEKITSTLLRGEELSSPRRLAVTLADPTVPDTPPEMTDAGPAPELSPTASTVGRRRTLLTLLPGTTRTRIAAFLGGGLATLAVVVVFLAVGRTNAHPTPTAPPSVDSAIEPPAADPQPTNASTAPPAVTQAAAQPVVTTKLVSPRRAPAYRAPAPRAAPQPAPPAAPTPPPSSKPTQDDELKTQIRPFSIGK